jgi:hypothetical protein
MKCQEIEKSAAQLRIDIDYTAQAASSGPVVCQANYQGSAGKLLVQGCSFGSEFT